MALEILIQPNTGSAPARRWWRRGRGTEGEEQEDDIEGVDEDDIVKRVLSDPEHPAWSSAFAAALEVFRGDLIQLILDKDEAAGKRLLNREERLLYKNLR